MLRLILLCMLCATVAGCRNKGIGAECKASGSGFTMRQPCKTLCMSLWRITCPSGEVGNSNVCGGELNCEKGSCPDGQVCFQTNMDRSVCVPESICPEWSDPALHPEVNLRSISSLKQKSTTTAIAPSAN